MGKEKHRNHLVPQFYLSQWENYDNKLSTYELVHKVPEFKTSNEICYIKDFYDDDTTDEIEDYIAVIEDRISKEYPRIINYLNTINQNPNLSWIPTVSEEDKRIIFQFLILQQIRTITYWKMQDKNKYNTPPTIYDEILLAKNNVYKIKNIMDNVDDYIQKFQNCYQCIIRTDSQHTFWTSSNPVHYGNYNNLLQPTDEILQIPKNYDTIMLPLSPTLKLIITFNNSYIDTPIPPGKLIVLPINYVKHDNRFNYEKIMNAYNFALLQGHEAQASLKQSERNDIRNTFFYIVSKRFSEENKKLLKTINVIHN